MSVVKKRAGSFFLTLLMAVMVGLSGCSTTIGELPSEPAPALSANLGDSYLLEPGNRVRVVIFNETNLSGDFTVDPLGNIALPLVGNIAASGVTARVLSHRIEEALKRSNLMQDPSVSVEVQTFRPFYVMGEVRQPGEFPYSSGLTVLSAIARAGGYDYRARKEEVVLVRVVEGQQKEFLATERTPILPGDIIKVLERRL